MRTLADTISRLGASRAAMARAPGTPAGDRLRNLDGFGSNAGALRARCHVPDALPRGAALVVVLHGCTQSAAAYDQGAGWSTLADQAGFAVLFPEQTRANNPNLCFNWFVADDIRRDCGEAGSIRQMIARMVADHGIDPARIYVTGLSAGGAMASTMLATYPEVFAGGAIVAGLAHGVAGGMAEAFDRMRGHGLPDARRLETLVRSASAHDGPWPTISIWQGTADQTVAVANADAIARQWCAIHGLADAPDRTETVDGQQRRSWRGRDGRVLVEDYRIAGMGHGTPIASASGIGAAGPYMLDQGISSTLHIARFWGLIDGVQRAADAADRCAPVPGETPPPRLRRIPLPPIAAKLVPPIAAKVVSPVATIIDSALRAAGLMR